MEEIVQGKKYVILNDHYHCGLSRVYRIQAVAQFEVSERDGSRTVVSPGDFGGWIGGPQNLSQEGSCWVGKNSIVCNDAKVQENALVTDNAVVSGDSIIAGNARIYGSARVDSVKMSDHALIEDSAWVYRSSLKNDARICHQAVVENSSLSGYAEVAGESQVTFSQLDDCTVWGASNVDNSEIGKRCSVKDATVKCHSVLRHGALVSKGATVIHSILDGDIAVYNHSIIKSFKLIGENFLIDDAKIEAGSCLLLGPFLHMPTKILLCKVDCTISEQIVGIIEKEEFLYDDLIELVAKSTNYKYKDVKKMFDGICKLIWG